MIRCGVILAFVLMLAAPARAQEPMAARLSMEKVGDIQPGEYLAGDNLKFSLDGAQGYFLLRFEGNPEVFVLYSDYASLGGRVLKYDSGETALQVAGWGGMTLYTDAKPGGLPAVRTGDSVPLALQSVSQSEIQNAADDESEHLSYMRRLNLSFKADWDALAGDDALRARCFDALENAALGIDRFAASKDGRKALADHVSDVMITTGSKPTLALKNKTLVATFNPSRGYAGRASSRAIARALEHLLNTK